MNVGTFQDLFDDAPDVDGIDQWPIVINDALTRQQRGILDVMWDTDNERCLLEIDEMIAR